MLGTQIYVAGGYTFVSGDLSTLNIYDPVTDTWTSAPNSPVAHSDVGATV